MNALPEDGTLEIGTARHGLAPRNPLQIVWRRKSLVLLGLVVGLIGGVIFQSQRAPVYQTGAQVLVVKKRADVLPWDPVAFAAGAGAARHAADSAAGTTSSSTPARCLPGSGSVPATTVSLGQKMLAGLQATGTKTEYTIPAGQIGNEQPITVTSEKWVSEELAVTVSSTLHDPMIGDTQFHLSQIERTEPDPSLFAVPADYTLNDVTAGKPVVIQR